MASDNLKEKIIYLKLKNKDKEAFGQAYDEYLDHIYRFVFFKVGSRETAEDITSSVFLKTWDYIQNNRLKDYKTLKSFLYKVARNVIIDHYRRESKKNDISLDKANNAKEITDRKENAHKKAEINSDIAFIEEKMLLLKDEYREVILLRYINELTIAEMAEVLEKSKGNVRVTIFRAMQALRDIINE